MTGQEMFANVVCVEGLRMLSEPLANVFVYRRIMVIVFQKMEPG